MIFQTSCGSFVSKENHQDIPRKNEIDENPPNKGKALISAFDKLPLQVNILVFDSSPFQFNKIYELCPQENRKWTNLEPEEILRLLENSITKESKNKCMIAFFNLTKVTRSPQEVLKILKTYSSSYISIQRRKLDAYLKPFGKLQVTHIKIDVGQNNGNITKTGHGSSSQVNSLPTPTEKLSEVNIYSLEKYCTDALESEKCSDKKDSETKSEDLSTTDLDAFQHDEEISCSDKKDSETKRNDISITYVDALDDEESWPMKSIYKVSRHTIPPINRPPVFCLKESKRLLNGELGIQFTNDDVVLPFLAKAVTVLQEKHRVQSKVLPNHVLKPVDEDDIAYEHLPLYKHFGVPPLLSITYPFYRNVDGNMENNFNRLASFKDWPLTSPVSALRLVDSGFYLDVQLSSVACYACQLHIEIPELGHHLGGDSVLNMHLRLSENCLHARQQKRDKESTGSYVFPFYKPKSETNFGILSSHSPSAVQRDCKNPLPEINSLNINEKNVSSIFNSYQGPPSENFSARQPEKITTIERDFLPSAHKMPSTERSLPHPSNKTDIAKDLLHPTNKIDIAKDLLHPTNKIDIAKDLLHPTNKIPSLERNRFQPTDGETTSVKCESGYQSQESSSNTMESLSNPKNFPVQTENADSLSYMTMFGESNLQPHSLFGENISTAPAIEEMESSPSTGIFVSEVKEMRDFNEASLGDVTTAEEDQSYSIRHPDYKTVDSRLKTFSFWPHNDKQDKKVLVLCGFFFTGQQDIVRCFSCDIGLAEWDETDDPWSEHARHSPHCKYLKKMKGQDFINRVQQEWRKIYNPKTPLMQDFNRRLESFKTDRWPLSIIQTPKQIAEAGFYFTGEEDAVRCHYCDGGLREWEPGDDPWTEHARWFPFCKFVMKIKGIQFIDEIQQRYEMGAGPMDSMPQSGSNTAGVSDSNKDENDPLCSPAAQSVISMGFSKGQVQHVIDKFVAEKGHSRFDASELLAILLEMEDKGETFPPGTTAKPVSKSPSPAQVIATEASESEQELDPELIEEENERLKKQLLCVKCEKMERVIVFTPCGHRLVCKACSEPMKKCIKCKKKIQKKVKTFLC
ncbi:uncharacterized protein LOC125674198 isoform X2 [Ostrea edulis]|uniref:uncharacterized protein LOC125674198 isoform X2 n=1 Tax=Ostrea edulis TaxID=37623 RepID=UPI0024AF341D|nr:uncharacterized protein LOC125674198 isoform X2 [Ostrea edulis]XP_056016034.1 uncharacterized protein LOC125674198 isoform X2 [Ostrea edulis]